MFRFFSRKIQRRYRIPKHYPNAHFLAPTSIAGLPEDLAPAGSSLIGERFLDPLGPVRRCQGGRYVRLVEPGNPAIANLSSTSVSNAVAEGLIAPFRILPARRDEEFAVDVIGIEVPAAPGHCPVQQWPHATYFLAATRWISLNVRLLDDDMGLIDAHPLNFALRSDGSPVWVDHGSLVCAPKVDTGVKEFIEHILLPLYVLSRRPTLAHLIRGKILSVHGGLELGGTTTRLIFLASIVLGGASRLSNSRFRNDALRLTLRKMTLAAMSAYIARLGKLRMTGFWSDYRDLDASDNPIDRAELSERDAAILRSVVNLEWASLTDLGANDGFHIRLIAKSVDTSKRFCAVDSDDSAVSRFLAEVLNNPAHVWSARVGDFFGEAPKADVVLALAVTHHLALQQQYSFGAIAKHLSSLAVSHCLVEFMPLGLTASRSKARPTPEWYSLENFLAALRREFADAVVVNRYESLATSRVLIHAHH